LALTLIVLAVGGPIEQALEQRFGRKEGSGAPDPTGVAGAAGARSRQEERRRHKTVFPLPRYNPQPRADTEPASHGDAIKSAHHAARCRDGVERTRGGQVRVERWICHRIQPAGRRSARSRLTALPAVDHWWDSAHTWSGSAANLSLKAEAGSCFCEQWKDGNVEHGRVIMAIRDKMLRLQSALGPLQGRGVTGVLTFQVGPDDKGGGQTASVLTLTYVVNGSSASALDKLAPAVNDVLGEQFGRLVRFIETGKADPPWGPANG